MPGVNAIFENECNIGWSFQLRAKISRRTFVHRNFIHDTWWISNKNSVRSPIMRFIACAIQCCTRLRVLKANSRGTHDNRWEIFPRDQATTTTPFPPSFYMRIHTWPQSGYSPTCTRADQPETCWKTCARPRVWQDMWGLFKGDGTGQVC